MKPLNRRLLIELVKEEDQVAGAFFVPDDNKVEEFVVDADLPVEQGGKYLAFQILPFSDCVRDSINHLPE